MSVDAAVAFTEADRRAVEAAGARRAVRIPLGTNVPPEPLGAGEGGPEVVFVGNFQHAPNVDAALRMGPVLDRVRERHPGCRLTIVGPHPPDDVRALADDRTTVTGEVADVVPHLRRAAVVAAPLRLGGGMRVKVLEALAAGKAVVATPLAVEGLGVTSGRQLEIADDDAGLALAIERLLEDRPRREALGAEGRAWVAAELGWERTVTAYEALYRRAAR